MTSSPRNPSGGRRTRSIIVAGLVLASAMLIGVVASPFGASRNEAASAINTVPAVIDVPSDPPSGEASTAPQTPDRQDRRIAEIALGATGPVGNRVSVFDDDTPAVANLDAALLEALRHAATKADGEVEFEVNSGWRSAEYQAQLLREAIAQYGSAKEAARWVAPPERSAHVSGNAVDIGPTKAATWLADHGARYGLCRTYKNEPWHFELRPDAITDGCPAMYADPTKDPRLQ